MVAANSHDEASRQDTQHHPSRMMLIVGLSAAALALVVIVALEWSGTPEPASNPLDQITDSMPRQQVERILGAGTVVESKVEQIGAARAKIDVLEWRTGDGRQRIRIEFVDDLVLSKTVGDL